MTSVDQWHVTVMTAPSVEEVLEVVTDNSGYYFDLKTIPGFIIHCNCLLYQDCISNIRGRLASHYIHRSERPLLFF